MIDTSSLHEIRLAVGEAESQALTAVSNTFASLRTRLQVLVLDGPPASGRPPRGSVEGVTGVTELPAAVSHYRIVRVSRDGTTMRPLVERFETLERARSAAQDISRILGALAIEKVTESADGVTVTTVEHVEGSS